MRKPRGGIHRVLLWLSLAGLPLSTSTMATTAYELYNLSLQELSQIKVTTSTLHDETLGSVPSSMTVYTREDIRRLGLTDLNELINLVPGYQGSRADDSGLSYSMSVRGRRIGSSGREVLVLINGQRMNNDWSGGTNQHNNLIPIENVERVEFVRGPGSALYGSNALMGVINIITRSDREISAAASSHQGRHADLQWRAESPDGSIELYARDSRSDGENLRIFEPFPDPATPQYVDSADPFRANDFYLRASRGEFTVDAIATSRDMQRFYVAGYADDRTNAYDTRTENLNLGWKHVFSPQLSIEGHAFAANRELSVNSSVSLVPWLKLEGVVEEREVGAQWVLQNNDSLARWLVGAEWRNPELTDTHFFMGTNAAPHAIEAYQSIENGRHIGGIFGQYQYQWTTDTSVIAGLRNDNYSDGSEHASPRLGIVHNLDGSNVVKLLYSNAFRAPNRIETSVISPEYQSNHDLKPETAHTLELVWVRLFEEGYWSSTLFSTSINDAIAEAITPQLKRTWINREERVGGFESEWNYHWNAMWQSRFAFTRLFDRMGGPGTEANTLLGGSVSYTLPNWTFSLLADFQGPKQDNNEQDFPAHITTTEYTRYGARTVLGAHLLHQLGRGAEIFLHGDNLADKQYLSPANRAPNYVGVPGTGRLVTVGVRWLLD